MRVQAILAVSGLLSASAAFAAAPAPVVHISVRTRMLVKDKTVETPIKQYWIQGREKARLEGAKDKITHDDKLAIYTPSECWEVDLTKKKATHVVNDRKVMPYVPVVGGTGAATTQFGGLTYGNELNFFKAKHAQKVTVKGASGAIVDEYSLPIGSGFLSLQVDPKTNKPVTIALHQKDKPPIMSLAYVGYETIPYKDSLFKPPAGINVTTMTAAQVRKEQLEIAAKIANYKTKLLSDMQKKNGTF